MSSKPEGAPGTPQDPKRREDPLTDHSYDGIQEYDNPMPKWWLYLFYASIAYSVLYWLNVPGIGSGKGRIANYEREVAEAKARIAATQPAAPVVSAELLRSVASDPARLADGRTTFANTCAPCHRADGGGNIGPNLTDRAWLHGGKPMDLYKTVTGGVLDKGMPAWAQVLKPEQQVNVVGYVLTLRGAHVENPKPPQGVEDEGDEDEEPAAAGRSKD
jgi:cytochrome c oxidase cbb3-type subunit 3